MSEVNFESLLAASPTRPAPSKAFGIASIAGVVLALLCFAMPFTTVSCSGQNVMDTSGVLFVFGGTPRLNSVIAGDHGNSVPTQKPVRSAQIAFYAAIAALALSMVRSRVSAIVRTVLIAGSALALVVMRIRITTDFTAQARNSPVPIVLAWDSAYWVALLFLVAAAAIEVVCLARRAPRDEGQGAAAG